MHVHRLVWTCLGTNENTRHVFFPPLDNDQIIIGPMGVIAFMELRIFKDENQNYLKVKKTI